jgi:hypothetical protein
MGIVLLRKDAARNTNTPIIWQRRIGVGEDKPNASQILAIFPAQ